MVPKKSILRFWIVICCFAVFITACGGSGGSSAPTSTETATPTPTVTVTPQPDDRTPASFTFTSATDVSLGATVDSNSVTIDDISVSVAVTITDGEYSINNGAFSSSEGVISEGDTLTLRGVASSEFSSDVIVGVTVGAVTETFTITTAVQDITPDDFGFTAVDQAPLDSTIGSSTATITGITGAVPISVSNGEYRIDGGAYTSVNGTIENGQEVQVRATSASLPDAKVELMLTIGSFVGVYSVTTIADEEAPTANIVFPTPVTLTYGTTLKVRGTAEDALSDIASVTVDVLVDDVVFDTETLDKGNLSTWIADVTLHADIENIIRVSLVDESGNAASNVAEVSVTHSSTATVFPEGNVSKLKAYRVDGFSLNTSTNQLLGFSDPLGFPIYLDVVTGVVAVQEPAFPYDTVEFYSDLYVDDNSALIAGDFDGDLYEINLNTLEPELLWSNVGDPETSGVLGMYTSDDELIYFIAGDENPSLLSYNRSSGQVSLLSDNLTPDGSNPFGTPFDVFIPDGSSKAIVTNYMAPAFPGEPRSYSFMWVDLNDGARTVIAESSDVYFSEMNYDSEKNQLVVYDTNGSVGAIYALDLENESFEKLFDDLDSDDNPLQAIQNADLDAGKRIMYTNTAIGVFVIDMETGDRVMIVSYPE
ncbi:hypothetical protein TDB9533_03486 [Thalassocella blandensis]|nr:hypothetical protein TDB9533_03486 [Thalassocella blandensis]